MPSKLPDFADELGDCQESWHPVTYLLAASWVAVYVGMLVWQQNFPVDANPLRFGGVGVETAHQFGDLTARSFAAGQIWRSVTASFIHFGLLHLVINTIGLVQFGRVLEEWYGSWFLLVVYLVIAGFGNSLAVQARIWLGGSLDVHAAGGSSVLFGFVGLILVAGWRMRTRMGDYMKQQMLWKLVIYGVIAGVLGRNILDNFGHAGGATAGAIVGFADRGMMRYGSRWATKIAGTVALAVMMACLVAQVGVARRMAEISRQERIFHELLLTSVRVDQIEKLRYDRGPFRSDPMIPLRAGLTQVLRRVDNDFQGKRLPVDRQAYQRWRELAGLAATRWLSPPEAEEFYRLYPPIIQAGSAISAKARTMPRL